MENTTINLCSFKGTLYKCITPMIGLYVSWSFTLWRLEQPDWLTHTFTGTHFTPGWGEAHLGLVLCPEKSDGPSGNWTRNLSIPKPPSYHRPHKHNNTLSVIVTLTCLVANHLSSKNYYMVLIHFNSVCFCIHL